MVIVTAKSIISENVLDEINFGLDERKKIIPILAEQVKMPLRIRRLQWVDFTGDKGKAFANLKKILDEPVEKST